MSPVQIALARQYLEQHSAFGQWAIARRLPALPTLPGYVAEFVAVSSMKLEDLIAVTTEVSRMHTSNGLADPCTAQVTAAFQAIAPIDPPRSWPKAQKARFTELPYGLQQYVAAHEDQREREIRRAHNEAADARKALAAIQKPTEVKTDVDTKEISSPTLEDRVRAWRMELDAVIDAKAEELKAESPGVPVAVLRNILTNRAFGCQCQAVLNLEQQA